MHRRIESVALAVATSLLAGCVSAARTNARLEPGWDVTVVGSDAVALGTDDDPHDAHRPVGELHLQFAHVSDQGTGAAVQLKVSPALPASAFDLFVARPVAERHHVGLGAELGFWPAIYAAYTYYFADATYATATPRVIARPLDRNEAMGARYPVTLTGQLAVGHTGKSVDLSVFAGYFHLFDHVVSPVGGCEHVGCPDIDRARFLLIGTSARF